MGNCPAITFYFAMKSNTKYLSMSNKFVGASENFILTSISIYQIIRFYIILSIFINFLMRV